MLDSADDQWAGQMARLWGVALAPGGMETFSGTLRFGDRQGRAVVLKVFKPGSDERPGIPALRHFAGHGAVEVLEACDTGLLMPRLTPGHDLTTLDDYAATRVFCDVAARLHAAGPAPDGCPTVADWGEGFRRHRISGKEGIPTAFLDDAEALFSELANSQADRVLLHGDLHHYNILWDAVSGWTVIDPKGVIGEPAYETGAFLRNPDDRALSANPSVLAYRLDMLAEQLGHDRQRMLAWHFAQAVLSAIWCIEDGWDPSGALETAESARSLL